MHTSRALSFYKALESVRQGEDMWVLLGACNVYDAKARKVRARESACCLVVVVFVVCCLLLLLLLLLLVVVVVVRA
jgi:hypothetical protein